MSQKSYVSFDHHTTQTTARKSFSLLMIVPLVVMRRLILVATANVLYNEGFVGGGW